MNKIWETWESLDLLFEILSFYYIVYLKFDLQAQLIHFLQSEYFPIIKDLGLQNRLGEVYILYWLDLFMH